MYACIHMNVWIHIYIHTHTVWYVDIHIYIHIYMYRCIHREYIYVYIFTLHIHGSVGIEKNNQIQIPYLKNRRHYRPVFFFSSSGTTLSVVKKEHELENYTSNKTMENFVQTCKKSAFLFLEESATQAVGVCECRSLQVTKTTALNPWWEIWAPEYSRLCTLHTLEEGTCGSDVLPTLMTKRVMCIA